MGSICPSSARFGRHFEKDFGIMDDRGEVCAALQALGIQAEMSERGRPEEEVYAGVTNTSSGVIDIVEGPIRWVNFIRAWFASVDIDSDMPEYPVYGIPAGIRRMKLPVPKPSSMRAMVVSPMNAVNRAPCIFPKVALMPGKQLGNLRLETVDNFRNVLGDSMERTRDRKAVYGSDLFPERYKPIFPRWNPVLS